MHYEQVNSFLTNEFSTKKQRPPNPTPERSLAFKKSFIQLVQRLQKLVDQEEVRQLFEDPGNTQRLEMQMTADPIY